MTFRWEADLFISASMEEISRCAFVCLKALRVLSLLAGLQVVPESYIRFKPPVCFPPLPLSPPPWPGVGEQLVFLPASWTLIKLNRPVIGRRLAGLACLSVQAWMRTPLSTVTPTRTQTRPGCSMCAHTHTLWISHFYWGGVKMD